jgi:starch synthase (maltosyl-transferring)
MTRNTQKTRRRSKGGSKVALQVRNLATESPPDSPPEPRVRAVIEGVKPEIACGQFPVKRVIGDCVTVEADIFTDGHDALSARLLYRAEGDADWQEATMEPLVNDRWQGVFNITSLTDYYYT